MVVQRQQIEDMDVISVKIVTFQICNFSYLFERSFYRVGYVNKADNKEQEMLVMLKMCDTTVCIIK